jgi:hypothetical protein
MVKEHAHEGGGGQGKCSCPGAYSHPRFRRRAEAHRLLTGLTLNARRLRQRPPACLVTSSRTCAVLDSGMCLLSYLPRTTMRACSTARAGPSAGAELRRRHGLRAYDLEGPRAAHEYGISHRSRIEVRSFPIQVSGTTLNVARL